MEKKIESTTFNNHTITECSPLNVMEDLGIKLFCPVTLTDKSEAGELRIYSQIPATHSIDEKKEIHQKIYQGVLNADETIFNRFHELNFPLFYSTSLNIDAESNEIDIAQMQRIDAGTIDAKTAIENGYVLRLFYSNPEDCMMDMINLSKHIDSHLSIAATLGFIFNLTEGNEVESSENPF